jgi:hypothetical protein
MLAAAALENRPGSCALLTTAFVKCCSEAVVDRFVCSVCIVVECGEVAQGSHQSWDEGIGNSEPWVYRTWLWWELKKCLWR